MFKWLFKRKSKDLDIIEVRDLIKRTSKLNTDNLFITEIRKSKTDFYFESLDEYLANIDISIRSVIGKIKIDKNNITNQIGLKEFYLEDWLLEYTLSRYSITTVNRIILGKMITLIEALETFDQEDSIRLSYYKRLNNINFRELYQWNRTIKEMIIKKEGV